jgi:uncharacterized protein
VRRFLIALMAVLALVAGPAFAQTFPPLTGRVVDDAHLLTPQQVAALDAKLAALEQQSQRQLVVATIPTCRACRSRTTATSSAAPGAGRQAAQRRRPADRRAQERKVRIEVGYGLEGILTDALSQVIIQREIVPRFKQNDYAGGIDAAVDQLIAQLKLPDDEARKVAEQAQAGPARAARRGSTSAPWCSW